MAGLAIIALWRRRPNIEPSFWLFVLWSLGAVAMYAIVALNTRYIAAFWVLLWVSFYRAVADALRITQLVPAAVAMFGIIVTAISTIDAPRSSGALIELVEARQLASMGLHRGDAIAFVGQYPRASYVARLAGLHIVAQVPDAFTMNRFRLSPQNVPADAFWTIDRNQLAAFESTLRAAGVKAILALNGVCRVDGTSWRPLAIASDCIDLL